MALAEQEEEGGGWVEGGRGGVGGLASRTGASHQRENKRLEQGTRLLVVSTRVIMTFASTQSACLLQIAAVVFTSLSPKKKNKKKKAHLGNNYNSTGHAALSTR